MEKEMYKPLPILEPSSGPQTSGGHLPPKGGRPGQQSLSASTPLPIPFRERVPEGRVRATLAEARGKDYWRSLDELADTPEFRKFLEEEFPSKHELWMDPISRRDFLKLMGASMAMMFFSGCRKPLQKIFPYNDQPEAIVPGNALFYATA